MRNWNDRNHLYLTQYDGIVKQIDTALNMSDYTEIAGENILLYQQHDLDDDGFDEFIFTDRSQQDLIIARNDFSHPVRERILHCLQVLRGNRDPLWKFQCATVREGIHGRRSQRYAWLENGRPGARLLPQRYRQPEFRTAGGSPAAASN